MISLQVLHDRDDNLIGSMILTELLSKYSPENKYQTFIVIKTYTIYSTCNTFNTYITYTTYYTK